MTPALISGAIAGRIKFKSYIAFIALWGLIVYAPVCHWVLGGRRTEERRGTGGYWYLTAKSAKFAKDPTALALRPLRSLRCSISQIIYFNSCRQRTNTTSILHSGTAGYPCIHVAPQKRLPAPTPQGRVERTGRGTRAE